MISSKIFASDGSNTRFLSDFIIRSEQFCRVYNYVYDADGVDGDTDVASGLTIRIVDVPQSEDLVTIDKWDLVDNSISFYTSPYSGSRVYIEVATTAEEFGNTLVQPAVERAEEAAVAAEASATLAAASEAAAALSEAAATLSETNTSASEAAALASQNASALSESNASASETAAGLSVAAAALSEAAAALSEANASASKVASEAAQSAAEVAETGAVTAQGLAEDARDKAQEWAENPEDSAVEVGQYSALHWAAKASMFNPSLYATLSGAIFTGQVKGITPVTDEDLTRKDYVDGRVDALGTPLDIIWDGLVLDETTTPKLSEVGIVGATPEAKLYPDGSIVGSSSNGSFAKYANGNLECKGEVLTGTNALGDSYPLPLTFVGAVVCLAGAQGFVSSGITQTVSSLAWTTDNINILLKTMRNNSGTLSVIATDTGWTAIGRWK